MTNKEKKIIRQCTSGEYLNVFHADFYPQEDLTKTQEALADKLPDYRNDPTVEISEEIVEDIFEQIGIDKA